MIAHHTMYFRAFGRGPLQLLFEDDMRKMRERWIAEADGRDDEGTCGWCDAADGKPHAEDCPRLKRLGLALHLAAAVA